MRTTCDHMSTAFMIDAFQTQRTLYKDILREKENSLHQAQLYIIYKKPGLFGESEHL